MELTFVYLPESPWSQKARVALRHHGVALRERIHTPLVGEAALRFALRKWRGRVTVPVLFTESGPLLDSWEIARFAERIGGGAPLFPEAKLAEIADWNACSQRLMAAGRGRSMLRVLAEPESMLEAMPPLAAKLFGLHGARLSTRAFNAKYGIEPGRRADYDATLRSELTKLRAALGSGRRYLVGEFSYADIALALSLTSFGPFPGGALAPGIQRLAIDTALASEFAELGEWRAELFARHPW